MERFICTDTDSRRARRAGAGTVRLHMSPHELDLWRPNFEDIERKFEPGHVLEAEAGNANLPYDEQTAPEDPVISVSLMKLLSMPKMKLAELRGIRVGILGVPAGLSRLRSGRWTELRARCPLAR